MQKNDAKVINAWCLYDWANSAYNLVVLSTLFPAYYLNVTQGPAKNGLVELLPGWTVLNTVLYSYTLSGAFLLAAALSPLLAGIADYGDKRKLFMQGFTWLGALTCAGLFFFQGPNILYGTVMFGLATFGYTGALVFYYSFLPVIAHKDQFNAVSARGYAYGYVGSVLFLVAVIALMIKPVQYGFSSANQVQRFAFAGVGIWWVLFAHFSFKHLPTQPWQHPERGHWLTKGYAELRKVWKQLGHLPEVRRYLAAFLGYSIGVQTIMFLAATYAKAELGLTDEYLVLTILIIQLVAIPGAWTLAKLAQARGNHAVVRAVLVAWICVCVLAYVVTDKYQFFGLAAVVGFMMGGIQSLSRSTYALLIPRDTKDTASYFSFYDVMEKLSIVLGTALFGLVSQLSGDMRNGIMLLTVFFAVGLFLFNRVNIGEHRPSVHRLRSSRRGGK
ncbi:MAG: MFS transporter [Bernardetiaceae bacterium]|jgi:UMF1 family MFS transporter|nr:MFS transporter [Bernardetiaceae bacterium]